MATRRKVMVSTVYEFSQIGAEELIRNIKDSYDDPESSPFIVYEATTRMFSAEVDPDDGDARERFLTQLARYIDFDQSNQRGFDDEPRIRPVEGTVIEDILQDDRSKSGDYALLEYRSEEESDDQDALKSLQHLTAYWKPVQRDSSILLPMYAQEITRLTGSSLFAEDAEKQYRIFQGNFRLAQEKLLRLEPLLEIFKTQQGAQSLMATGNLLVWPPNNITSRIEFVAMNHDHPSFSRVIVNKMERFLFSKVVGELRTWTPATQQYSMPQNFFSENVSATDQIHASKIWDGVEFPSFGDPTNKEPILTSNPTSVENSDSATVPDSGEARIAQWTTGIVTGADPDIAPEVPVEPPVAPARRRVVVDSDSDDEDIPAPKSLSPSSAKASREDGAPPEVTSNGDLMETEADEPLISIMESPPSSRVRKYKVSAASELMGGRNVMQDLQAPTAATVPSLMSFLDSSPPGRSVVHPNIESFAGPTSPESTAQASIAPPLDPAATDSNIGQVETTFPLSRPAFNPNAYGSSPKPARGGSRVGSTRSHRSSPASARGKATSHHHQTTSKPEQDPTRGNQTHRNGGTRGSAHIRRGSMGRGSRVNSRPAGGQRDLIDVSAPPRSQAPRVPPGFESHVPLIQSDPPPSFQISKSLPADEAPRARTEPQGSFTDSRSMTSGDARLRFSDEGADYKTTFIPRKNQAMLRENSLRAAYEAIAAQELKAARQPAINKKAEDDDMPELRATMGQKSGNPGKKSNKQETKAEKRDRIAKAKEEAFGPLKQVTPLATRTNNSNSDAGEMSKWKKNQMKKNPVMAESHPEVAADELREQQNAKLLSLLGPVFEIGRSFSGRLRFEIQFGQVLVSSGPQIHDVAYHTAESWSALFDSSNSSSRASSSFTNILTTNGADVDRILATKGPARNDEKFWSSQPGPKSVSYEFACQSRTNEDFLIVVDQFGKHELRKGQVTVGAVSIHVPAQVWDASATMCGALKWMDPPESVKKSAAAFVDSIYIVPQKTKLTIVFREPNDHEIKIRNLIVKRVSHHARNQPGLEDIKLQVTEAKSLLFKVHPQDKKLWQGYEATNSEYNQLVRNGRIHYELSLIHEGINAALAANEDLEVGELTDEAGTGKSLLDRATVRSMLDTAVQMVSKMDFMGMHNFGTQLRLHAEEEERLRNIQASLGPAGKTVLQVPVRGTAPSMSASRLYNGGPAGPGGPSGNTTVAPIPAGVRMGIDAQLMVDVDGTKYYLGMGGARIPVVDNDEDGDDGEPLYSSLSVVPEDSASQMGGPAATMRQGQAHAQQAQNGPAGMRQPNREGAGFW